jgi:hypothetical protein
VLVWVAVCHHVIGFGHRRWSSSGFTSFQCSQHCYHSARSICCTQDIFETYHAMCHINTSFS